MSPSRRHSWQVGGSVLALGGAAGLLIATLAVPWYESLFETIKLGSVHSTIAWILVVSAIPTLVSALGAHVRAGATRHVVRFARAGLATWSWLAVALVVYAMTHSGNEFLVTGLASGAMLALIASLAMAIGATVLVRFVAKPPGTKVCPRCAEKVNAVALICKHCGSDLAAGRLTDASARESRSQRPTQQVGSGHVRHPLVTDSLETSASDSGSTPGQVHSASDGADPASRRTQSSSAVAAIEEAEQKGEISPISPGEDHSR